jgi:hypothetical protein
MKCAVKKGPVRSVDLATTQAARAYKAFQHDGQLISRERLAKQWHVLVTDLKRTGFRRFSLERRTLNVLKKPQGSRVGA